MTRTQLLGLIAEIAMPHAAQAHGIAGRVPALAAIAPGGVTLDVASDGRLVRIGSGHGQTIVVRGVPLNSKTFELRGGIVVSELAAPFLVASEARPAGTKVRIDLATGDVMVSSE